MKTEITEQKQCGNRKVYTYGFPDYHGLSDEQKYRLLYPLAQTIHKYYQDSANREKFEKWKVEYLKQNPAKPQDFSLTYLTVCNIFNLVYVVFAILSKQRILVE